MITSPSPASLAARLTPVLHLLPVLGLLPARRRSRSDSLAQSAAACT